MKYRVRSVRKIISRASLALFAALVTSPAYASGTGMPWESRVDQIVDSLTGPVAKGAGILAIAFAGLGMAISDGGSGMRKFANIVFGLSIAFTAGSFGASFFGFSGGASF